MAFHPVHPSYDPNSLTFFSLPCVFFPSLVTTFLIWLILQEHRSSRNLSSYFELHIFFLLFLFQIPKLPNIDPQLQKNAMAASSFMDRAPISELLGWPPPPLTSPFNLTHRPLQPHPLHHPCKKHEPISCLTAPGFQALYSLEEPLGGAAASLKEETF